MFTPVLTRPCVVFRFSSHRSQSALLRARRAPLSALAPTSARVSDTAQVVESVTPDRFTVSFRADRAIHDYWCSAGEFVIRELNLPRNTRIYRVVPPPPRPQASEVTFSLSAEGAVHPGISVISSTGRSGLSASQARNLCNR